MEFFVKDGKLYHQNNPHLPQLVVTDLKKQIAILIQVHKNLGYKKEQAVFELIKIQFYWPHMQNDLHYHVALCHKCQIRNTKKMEVSVIISIPSISFEKVYINVIYMPSFGGYHYIVAAKDNLTGVTEAQPL